MKKSNLNKLGHDSEMHFTFSDSYKTRKTHEIHTNKRLENYTPSLVGKNYRLLSTDFTKNGRVFQTLVCFNCVLENILVSIDEDFFCS